MMTTVCRSQGRKEGRNRGTPEAYGWAEGEEGEKWGENAGVGEDALFCFCNKGRVPSGLLCHLDLSTGLSSTSEWHQSYCRLP